MGGGEEQVSGKCEAAGLALSAVPAGSISRTLWTLAQEERRKQPERWWHLSEKGDAGEKRRQRPVKEQLEDAGPETRNGEGTFPAPSRPGFRPVAGPPGSL